MSASDPRADIAKPLGRSPRDFSLHCAALQPQQPPGRPYRRFSVFGGLMRQLAAAIAVAGLIGTPAFAADMAVKAPPPAPAPVYSWNGWYAGFNVGGIWGGDPIDLSTTNQQVCIAGCGGGPDTVVASAQGKQPALSAREPVASFVSRSFKSSSSRKTAAVPGVRLRKRHQKKS